MGDAVTGASIYWLDEVVDGGDILIQKPVFVLPGWDYHRLWKEIFPVGVDLILKAVSLIERGEAPRVRQDGRFKTWEPPFNGSKIARGDLFQLAGGGGRE